MEEDEEKDYIEEDDLIQEEIITEIIDGEKVQIEESTSIEDGHLKFVYFNNSSRAETRELMSDGNIAYYLNVALEYFNYRCAISGEPLKDFGGELGRNLSGEHIVPLCAGGHDRVENVVPTVLKYNILKNGYHPIEWWINQKDENGKSLYSPYRLLKLLNYMTKALEARREGLHPDKFRKVVLENKTALDEYIAKIEEQDEQETDNNKRKIISSTETAGKFGIVEFEGDEEGRKYLEPGNIPTLRQQQNLHMQFDEVNAVDIFLQEALRKVEEEIGEELKQETRDGNTLWNIIEGQVNNAMGIIPFEIQVRNQILEVISDIERKYSVADELLLNTDIVEYAREHQDESSSVKQYVENYINEQKTRIQTELELTDEQLYTIISNRPNVLTDKRVVNRIKLIKQFEDGWQELLERDETPTEMLVIVLKKLDELGIDITKITMNSMLGGFLENLEEITPEEKEEIIEYLHDEINAEIDENWTIGSRIHTAKLDENIEYFKEQLKEAFYEKPGYVRFLIMNRNNRQTTIELLVEVLKVLDESDIDITQIKINVDTLYTFLDRLKSITLEEKKEIIEYLHNEINAEIDENWKIGNRIGTAKSDKNIEYFQEQLEEIFPTQKGYVKYFIRDKRNNQTTIELLVEVLRVLDERGIDLKKITQNSTLGEFLEKLVKVEEKEETIEYLHNEINAEIDENWKIGSRISTAKLDKNIEYFKEQLKETFRNKEDIIEFLVKKTEKGEGIELLVEVLKVIDKRDIDITQIRIGVDTLNTFLDRFKDITLEEKEEIIEYLHDEINAEIDENWTIGRRISNAKIDKNIEYFQEQLEEAFPNKTGYVRFFIMDRNNSQTTIELLVEVLKALDERGIDITKINQRSTLGGFLEKLESVTPEEKEEIIEYLHNEINAEIDENWKIGNRISKAKIDNNIENFKEQLKETFQNKEDIVEFLVKKTEKGEGIELLVEVLKVLDERGIDLKKITQNSTLGESLEKLVKVEEKEEIIECLHNEINAKIDENWKIGSRISTAKSDKNIECFKKQLKETFQNKEDIVEFLVKKTEKGEGIELLVEVLKVLDNRRIDLTKITNDSTLGEFLEKLVKVEEKEEIIEYLHNEINAEIDEKWKIGSRIHTAKSDENIEYFKEQLKGVFSTQKGYVKYFIRDRRNNQSTIKLLVEVIKVLDERGIDLTKITQNSTLSEFLEKLVKLEEKKEIIEFLHNEINAEIDENWKIGNKIVTAKRHIGYFKELLYQAIDQGTTFTEAELKKLLGTKNQDKVEELLQAQERYRQAKEENAGATSERQEAEQENESAKGQRDSAKREEQRLQQELQQLQEQKQRKNGEEVRENE